MGTPPRVTQEHAALLAAIVQSSDDAIVSKTLDGIITSWNGAAEKIFGYTAAEAIGQSILLIIPPELHSEETEIIARIKRGESVEHFRTERVAKGGERVHVSLTVSPVRAASGEIVGASKVARDIGDRVRGEVVNARLAAIVDSSDDAIVSKTLDGVIQSWNRGAQRIFGYSAAEAVGRHITLIIPPERLAEEDDVIARIRRGDTVDHFETVRVAKDGTRVQISLTVSPIRDATGRVIGASKIARDITKEAQREAERAALLAREQEAREEAEMLNRSKDQFLAVLSHELRTPLNAIYGWARMLTEGHIDPQLHQRGAEVILRNAKAQLQLVEDLLDVSRIITGNMRLDVRPVDLKAVIEAALETVRPAATAKEIRLQSVLDARVGPVIGAADRLQQIVWNVVMNAVKFTPRGGRIQVLLRGEADRVDIVVSDSGEGIDPALLPHVFDRFRQGDSSSTRAHGGLGLGLALVRHLVDLHGGTVRAESAGVGQGATFVVSLPVSATRHEPVAAAPNRAAASLRGVRVLVVDDDADGLELARTVLGHAGAEVRTCASPATVPAALAGWTPDALALDIELPGEDGYDLLRRLREHGLRAPALALTAYSRGEDRRRALAAGFVRHLSKPVDPGELTAAVADLVGRRA
ncbi:MAG TPA: PAS domain S-box protein [Terriglobales bacterium]|nr:PAS domain S-box protein [Terriglobales bacterium]